MRAALFLAAILICAIAPWVIPNSQVLLTIALAKGLAVLGVIVLLQAGQVSFGHALFYAIAAYGTAFLGKAFAGGELFVAMIIGTLSAALAGVIVGLFVVRYRHIFFGMLNLAVSMIFFSILEKFYYVTGGSDGLRVERPSVLGIVMERGPFEVVLFYVTLACAALAMIVIHRFLASPIGNHLRAIKSNEVRLEYLGISPRRVLLTGYVVSAALCGLGGSLMAVTQGIVTPEYAWWVRSGEFVFIAILGGSGSVGGAFVGALVYEGVRTYAAAFAADIWQLILGSVLLLVILFAPKGLMGFVKLPKAGKTAPKPNNPAVGETLGR